MEAYRRDNARAVKLCKAIDAIPREIKDFVLSEYVRRIQYINGIFFFASRMQSGDADVLECQMQIINLKRRLRKGILRDRKQLVDKKKL